MRVAPLRIADHQQLRAVLVLLDESFELPVNQFQTPRNLLLPVRPAFLPVVELVFGVFFAGTGLIEVLLQSQ
jgi:hypothetical protein